MQQQRHHHSSITAVAQYVPTNPQRQHSSRRQELGGICTFLRFSTFRGKARQHSSTAEGKQQQQQQRHYHSSITAVAQYVPTNPQRQHSSRRQGLGGICTFLRFSTLRGRARAVPGRGFSCPPLTELGVVGRSVVGNTEV